MVHLHDAPPVAPASSTRGLSDVWNDEVAAVGAVVLAWQQLRRGVGRRCRRSGGGVVGGWHGGGGVVGGRRSGGGVVGGWHGGGGV
eukprot:605081-Prorocentrum_minimum.AAC.2